MSALCERMSSRADHTTRDFGEGHELLGRRLLRRRGEARRLYELTHGGRGRLLDQTGRLAVAGWAGRVDDIVDLSEVLNVPAALLRPAVGSVKIS